MLRWFAQVGCILSSFLELIFLIMPKIFTYFYLHVKGHSWHCNVPHVHVLCTILNLFDDFLTYDCVLMKVWPQKCEGMQFYISLSLSLSLKILKSYDYKPSHCSLSKCPLQIKIRIYAHEILNIHTWKGVMLTMLKLFQGCRWMEQSNHSYRRDTHF